MTKYCPNCHSGMTDAYVESFGDKCFVDGRNEERDLLFSLIRSYFTPEETGENLIEWLEKETK